MTYIDYLNAFNQWLETNPLPVSSQLLYYKLLYVFNRAGWPEEVGVDNLRVRQMLGGVTEKTAIQARDRLVEAGFITYQRGRKGFHNRYALPKKHCNFYSKTVSVSVSENDSISASINASHIKTKTKNPSPYSPPRGERERFVSPTVEEVRAYCMERHSCVSPEEFVDYYASNGWMVGKTKMRDWQAAVRTWERKRLKDQPPPPEQRPTARRTGHLEVDENGEEVVVYD